jgi:hypothetical protein
MERDMDTPDCHREKTSVAVDCPGSLESVEDVIGMLANNMGFANFLSIISTTDDPKLKGLFSECSLKIYCLLKREDFQNWFNKYGKKQPQLYVILFMRIDSISTQLAAMAQNSSVMAKIDANEGHKLKSDPRITNAIRIVFLLNRELEDKYMMGAIFQDIPRITPDASNPDKRASKLQKISETAANQTSHGEEEEKSTPPNKKKSPRKPNGPGGL